MIEMMRKLSFMVETAKMPSEKAFSEGQDALLKKTRGILTNMNFLECEKANDE
jgi:hypothetical protein